LTSKVSAFFQTGIEWVFPVQEHHDNLAELLVEIAKELNVRLDKILNEIKSWSRLEELRWKEEQIRNLEKK